MSRKFMLALPFLVMAPAIACAQTQNDTVAPTIPETQIKPAELSSPYEFLSASTSADDFIIKADALAASHAESADVKSMATELSTMHTKLTADANAAGKLDKVDIAAPAVDGEQKGLLAKLEALDGAAFDRAFVEAQIFVHQRTISYYKGYSDNGNNLAAFAAANLPALVEHYNDLTALAGAMGLAGTEQKPAPQQ